MQLNQKPLDYSYIELLPVCEEPIFALLGFASDTGVRRNNGRAGALDAPNAIREELLEPSALKLLHQSAWIDCGNIIVENDDLEYAQLQLAHVVKSLKKKGYFPLVLGGGHETSYGHYLGLMQHQKKNIQICNLDAHFDLRDVLENNHGSSNSPFWQIAQHCQQNKLIFNYSCWGIQTTSNSDQLFSRAKDLKVNYLLAEECSSQNTQLFYSRLIKKNQPIYLTVCLDVLAADNAPGVSAPQPEGIHPEQLIHLVKQLAESSSIEAFDIVELAPKLDVQNKTSKLAAHILLTFMQAYTEKQEND